MDRSTEAVSLGQYHGPKNRAATAVAAVGSLIVRGFRPDQISLIHFMSFTEFCTKFNFYSTIVQIDELFCLMAASSGDQFSIN